MMTAVSSIARPVTSMTGQSACLRKICCAYSSSAHLIPQGVVRVDAHAELLQARLADLEELLEADREADDAVLGRLFELGRRRRRRARAEGSRP